MAFIRSTPITDKQTSVDVDDTYYAASSCVQGWRVSMEDQHIVLLETPMDKKCSYFAVFDGHGGSNVAKLAKRYLHLKILTQSAYHSGNIKKAIREGFISMDLSMMEDSSLIDGSTAVIILIRGPRLYCGNAGDSRAFAFVGNNTMELSQDHKPTLPQELERITNAGFTVVSDRLDGCLAVSRGLGDFMYKRKEGIPPTHQAVSCLPDVRFEYITEEWKFIFLGSDGIFEVLSSEEVGTFVMTRMNLGLRPELIVEQLLDHCMSTFIYDSETGVGADNMSAILVIFRRNVNENYKKVLKQQPALKYLGPSGSFKHESELRTSEAGPSGIPSFGRKSSQ